MSGANHLEIYPAPRGGFVLNDCKHWAFCFSRPVSKNVRAHWLALAFRILRYFQFRRFVILYIVIIVVIALSIARILITRNSGGGEGMEKDKVKALAGSTIKECRQRGFTVKEMEDFLTCLQIEVMQRKEELRKELF